MVLALPEEVWGRFMGLQHNRCCGTPVSSDGRGAPPRLGFHAGTGMNLSDEDKIEALKPGPCGCTWLSECCGAPPHMATPDVAADSPAGICSQCRDNTGFEPEETAWKYKGQTLFGADADGNRGVPLLHFECPECGNEMEVIRR